MVKRSDRAEPIGLLAALDRLYTPRFSHEDVEAMVPNDETTELKFWSNDPTVKLGTVSHFPISTKNTHR